MHSLEQLIRTEMAGQDDGSTSTPSRSREAMGTASKNRGMEDAEGTVEQTI